MHVCFLNLDRHPGRRERMVALLQGLSFERIRAVDGKHLDGLEHHDPQRPRSPENISKYEQATVMTHRAAWSRLLERGDRYGCVLEDDVLLSPDFPGFTNETSWLPPDGDLVKIETNQQRVFLSRRTIPCLNRHAARLMSTHLGAAGYVISDQGARALLAATARPDRPLDYLLFDHDAIRLRPPIYQVFPALCMQTKNLEQGMPAPEMRSSIQDQVLRSRKPPVWKIKAELIRPFRQLKRLAESFASGQRLHGRRCLVPFE